MAKGSNSNDNRNWCEQRRVKLNELIIRQLLQLTDDDIGRVRAHGHVMAMVRDIVENQMTENTVRIEFIDWNNLQGNPEVDGREWLMAFNFAVEFCKAPEYLHVDEPLEHPWVNDFDKASSDHKRAMLIQFAVRMDPIRTVQEDLVHYVSPEQDVN